LYFTRSRTIRRPKIGILSRVNLDLWILAGLALFGAHGCLSGAIRQVSQRIGLAAAYFPSKPLAALAAPALARRLKAPAPR
jgi:hypothetical protein